MNHIETGIQTADVNASAAIPAPIGPASNAGLVWNGSSWVAATLVNANINAAAAIAYSKLNLAGGIVNNDVSSSAAIAYSKLSLGTSIVNADVATAAAIALSKLADPGSGNVVTSTGSGAVAAKPPGYELAYAEITAAVTGITATTAATAVSIVAAGAVTFDGTAVLLEFFAPQVDNPSSGRILFEVYDVNTDTFSLGAVGSASATANNTPVRLPRRFTPSAAAHTYGVRAYVTTGTGAVQAGTAATGALPPAFIRITKA